MVSTETRIRPADTEPEALFRRWHEDGDTSARDALISKFQPLARSLARRYDRSTEAIDDLVQVANIGLINAVDRFDPERGIPFTAYAVPTILGEIKRYFRDCSWAVHVPRAAQERALAVESARQTITADSGRQPSVSELSRYLELSQEEVLAALETGDAYNAVSLDAPRPLLGDEEARSYGDTLGAEDGRFEFVDCSLTLQTALKELPAREREVLALRFAGELTQAEIASRIGISQMQVSRLLRKSLQQLREITDAEQNS